MKIAVLIKRVPDTELRFAIGADGRSLDPSGLKYDMSDFDGYAAEIAIRQKEQAEAGEVVVIGLGGDGVPEILRKALSMGADRGVHLTADEVPADGSAVAAALAAELEGQGYDLILFGRQATDTGHGTVGAMTAARLNLPCVTAISALELQDGGGTARRELEGATETVRFPLPAVLTIDEGIARARIPALKGIMAAKKKPIETRPAQLGEVRLTITSLELPPERSGGRIVGEGAAAVPELVRLLREEAKAL